MEGRSVGSKWGSAESNALNLFITWRASPPNPTRDPSNYCRLLAISFCTHKFSFGTQSKLLENFYPKQEWVKVDECLKKN